MQAAPSGKTVRITAWILGAKRPGRASGRVVELDAGGGETVADAIGELPGLLRAQLGAQRDESVDDRTQEFLRITQADGGGLAEAMHERVEHRARAIRVVRLQ